MSEGGLKILDVAMSLLLRPKVFLMDEPTAWVSVEDKFLVMETLMPVLKDNGVTILFVEYDIEIMEQYSQRTLAFDSGKIISDGSARKVFFDSVVGHANLGI